MTDQELEAMELELRRTRPARLPDDFAARLRAAEPKMNVGFEPAPSAPPISIYLRTLRQSLRWLIPATAMVLVLTMTWKMNPPFAVQPSVSKSTMVAAPPALKANDVKIDQRLVSSFDTVARLPGGEPVRFRCENWVDQLVLTDTSRGLVVENSQPRVEVVPVGFETY